jgi:hypothetical protein
VYVTAAVIGLVLVGVLLWAVMRDAAEEKRSLAEYAARGVYYEEGGRDFDGGDHPRVEDDAVYHKSQ